MDWKQIITSVIVGAILGGASTFFAFQGRISKLEAQIKSLSQQVTSQSVVDAELVSAYATVTAQAIEPSPLNDKVILSKQTEIFSFDSGNTGEWKSFEWSDGWLTFKKSGVTKVTDEDFTLDGHKGSFLQYPLDLESQDKYTYLTRNAIYKLVNDEVIGIVANVYYESEEGYNLEEILAGFVIPYKIGPNELVHEDYLKNLVPDRWNTIIWSLYSPVWVGDQEKEKKWLEYLALQGDNGVNLQPGRRLDNIKIDGIGIQFLVNTEGGPKQFKGTVYFDNITLIYRRPIP